MGLDKDLKDLTKSTMMLETAAVFSMFTLAKVCTKKEISLIFQLLKPRLISQGFDPDVVDDFVVDLKKHCFNLHDGFRDNIK